MEPLFCLQYADCIYVSHTHGYVKLAVLKAQGNNCVSQFILDKLKTFMLQSNSIGSGVAHTGSWGKVLGHWGFYGKISSQAVPKSTDSLHGPLIPYQVHSCVSLALFITYPF